MTIAMLMKNTRRRRAPDREGLTIMDGIREFLTLDIYVEVPDGFGGFIRHYEVPELIRIAAPLYVKLGLRNSPDIYPCGTHLENTAIALSIERVRRARLVLDQIQRHYPEAVMGEIGAADLAIPEISHDTA